MIVKAFRLQCTMALEDKYKTLICETLPSLAQANASTQAAWPVRLDHCFARIILDAVVGRGEYFCTSTSTMMSSEGNTPSPWLAKLKSPAVRNMNGTQLAQCIALAEALADGKVDLCEMDEQSLWFRGKSSERKRPLREDYGVPNAKRLKSDPHPPPSKPLAWNRKTSTQQDIRHAFSTPVTSDSSHPPAATIDEDLRELIEESEMSTFRKRVLTTLCQVPKGHVSTYLALSHHLRSSPRAVGNVRHSLHSVLRCRIHLSQKHVPESPLVSFFHQ